MGRHQIEAKAKYHKHLNFERAVAVVALGSFVGALAVPGVFLLDQALGLSWTAHSYWGLHAIIGDYIPLIAPVAVAKLLQVLLLLFCIGFSAYITNLNLKIGEKTGLGHILRALMNL